ncbi:hypothetical protein GCM10022403_006530 [Streptomyces coacervatus]|uniref:Uncharacterized protein n=1 Tax=Streptomyces coacervatus TaxID=647381 RepID=A0ABP7GYL6_9ACTN
MRALREEHLQSTCTEAHLLDAPALRFHAVPLRVIENAPALRNFVVIGIGAGAEGVGDSAGQGAPWEVPPSP